MAKNQNDILCEVELDTVLEDEDHATNKLSLALARVFSAASMLVVDVLAFIALAAVAVSTWGVAKELLVAIGEGDMTSLAHVITSALTVFIFIEVLAVSVRYLRVHHIDIKDLIDVTLAIIFREIWVALFSHTLQAPMILSLAALIGVLGATRWLSTCGAPWKGRAR